MMARGARGRLGYHACMEPSRRRSQHAILVAALASQAVAGWIATTWLVTTGSALVQLLDADTRPQLRGIVVYLTALQFAAVGVGAIGAGLLSDWRGRQRVLTWAVAGGAVASALATGAFNGAVLGITAVLGSIAIGAAWAAAAPLLVETFSDRARGRPAGLMTAAAGVGAALGPAAWQIVAPLSRHAWRGLHAVAVLAGIACAIWIHARVVESRRSAAVMATRDAALRARDDGRAPSEEQAPLLQFPLSSAFSGSARLMRSVAALALAIGVSALAWSVGASAPARIAQLAAARSGSAGDWMIAAIVAIGLGSAIGSTGYGLLADRVGRRRTTQVALTLALVLTFMLWMTARSAGLQIVVALLLAAASGGAMTWFVAWLPELYSTRMRASMLGLAYGTPRIALALAIAAGAGGFVRSGALAACSVAAVAFAVALGASLRLPESRGLALPA